MHMCKIRDRGGDCSWACGLFGNVWEENEISGFELVCGYSSGFDHCGACGGSCSVAALDRESHCFDTFGLVVVLNFFCFFDQHAHALA